jgi:hypothetical protein
MEEVAGTKKSKLDNDKHGKGTMTLTKTLA